jgi:hypothetical protein
MPALPHIGLRHWIDSRLLGLGQVSLARAAGAIPTSPSEIGPACAASGPNAAGARPAAANSNTAGISRDPIAIGAHMLEALRPYEDPESTIAVARSDCARAASTRCKRGWMRSLRARTTGPCAPSAMSAAAKTRAVAYSSPLRRLTIKATNNQTTIFFFGASQICKRLAYNQ